MRKEIGRVKEKDWSRKGGKKYPPDIFFFLFKGKVWTKVQSKYSPTKIFIHLKESFDSNEKNIFSEKQRNLQNSSLDHHRTFNSIFHIFFFLFFFSISSLFLYFSLSSISSISSLFPLLETQRTQQPFLLKNFFII